MGHRGSKRGQLTVAVRELTTKTFSKDYIRLLVFTFTSKEIIPRFHTGGRHSVPHGVIQDSQPPGGDSTSS